MEKIEKVGNDDFEQFSQFFSKYTNDDVAPLKAGKVTVNRPWHRAVDSPKY